MYKSCTYQTGAELCGEPSVMRVRTKHGQYRYFCEEHRSAGNQIAMKERLRLKADPQ